MADKSQKLLEHLEKEHKRSPFQTYLKEIVYGGNDGIVTTFVIVAGFAGAQSGNIAGLSYLTVLLFGLANLFADGASMGLSNFLSLRAEKDVYKAEQAKELHEIRHNTASEKEETIEILTAKGFSLEQAKKIADLYATNEKYWLQFMMNDELEMPNPTRENPFLTGLATFLSFILFGFIPLIPYVLMTKSSSTLLFSVIATVLALILLGLLRWKTTKESAFRSVFEIVAIGGTSASIAYVVGTFFRA